MQTKKSEKLIDWDAVCSRVQTQTTRKGFTRQELAEKAGVSPRVVYKVMQGNARLRMDILGKLARALEVDPVWVLYGQEGGSAGYERPEGDAAPVRTLSGDWPGMLQDAVQAKKDVVETGYNEYRLPMDEALAPAIRAFEDKLRSREEA